MLACEWWIPEDKAECINAPVLIMDCDICKNAWACWEHVGAMIKQHYSKCQMTLHLEPLEHLSTVEEHPHGSE